MIWLSLISTTLGCCCDVLFVSARILAFKDRTGRSENEGVNVPGVRPSLPAPLEVEPEEVEPFAHVHHLGLGFGKP